MNIFFFLKQSNGKPPFLGNWEAVHEIISNIVHKPGVRFLSLLAYSRWLYQIILAETSFTIRLPDNSFNTLNFMSKGYCSRSDSDIVHFLKKP